MESVRPHTLATALGVILWAAVLAAHHSFAAEYDIKKPATITGRLTRIEWTNPHVRCYLDVTDSSGAVVPWEFTMGAVNGLLRRGWTVSMV